MLGKIAIPLGLLGLVLAGSAAAGAGKKNKQRMRDTLDALQSESTQKLSDVIHAWRAAGDHSTAGTLETLLGRMQAVAVGQAVPPVFTMLPDGYGSPATAEWNGALLTMEGRPELLKEWADVYREKGFPITADMLVAKAEGRLVNPNPADGSGVAPSAGPSTPAPSFPGGGSPVAPLPGAVVPLPGPVITPGGGLSVPSLPPLTSTSPGQPTGTPPATVPQTSPTPVTPDTTELQRRIADVVASGNAAAMRALADELDRLGFTVPANQLRARAAEILAAGQVAAVPTPPVVSVPTPPPVLTVPTAPVQPARGGTYIVQADDNKGPWGLAQKLTGDGNRWRELVKANPQYPKASDGSFQNMWVGMSLTLPSDWPNPQAAGGAPPVAQLPAPTPGVAVESPGRALALAANQSVIEAGATSTHTQAVVKQFQIQEGSAKAGAADGKYGPKTALAVASYGIIPAKPYYWSSATKSKDKAAYQAAMLEFASRDPARMNQWIEASKV